MKTVLFIGTVWPEPVSSAAGVRFLQTVEAFNGWRRVFASPAKVNAFETRVRALGLETAHFLPNDSAFDEWVKGLAPDVVVFERFVIEEQFGWRVREQCPQCVRILDMQDFHSLRKFREAELARTGRWGSDVVPPTDETMPEDVRREVASILRSDLTLVISDFERDLLVNQFGVPADGFCLRRFGFPERGFATSGRDARHGFLFIGNFRHTPNLDAVTWLVREIWPGLRRQTGAELLIAGAYPPSGVMALADEAGGVRVLGPIADQYELMAKVRVSLAPLRTGAGIKGKIAESWWMGTPVVTTSIGAEGMTGGKSFAGAVTDSVEAFVQAAADLYGSQDSWNTSSQCGEALMGSLYLREALDAEMCERVNFILRDVQAWRAKHPLAQILWAQNLRATEYFSRWIEAKNRNV